MNTFTNFAIKSEYERIAELGDKFGEVEKLIDGEKFHPILGHLYINKTDRGSRPNLDEIRMIKMVVLQQCHGLSDP